MPSWALRCAWSRPLIWLRIFSEMPRPAASSAARLMRWPLESFSIDFEAADADAVSWRWVLNASMLFWMRRPMIYSLWIWFGLVLTRRLLVASHNKIGPGGPIFRGESAVVSPETSQPPARRD